MVAILMVEQLGLIAHRNAIALKETLEAKEVKADSEDLEVTEVPQETLAIQQLC